jgi:hypothetical protein
LLAAHANAARGRDVLWLVGVKTGATGRESYGNLRTTGVQMAEFDGWLEKLLPYFDGLAPKVQAFMLPFGTNGTSPQRQLIVLHIETARAPFVFRPSASSATLEVPWLDSAPQLIRSAGRHELLKLLVPLQDLPQCEVLDAELTFYKNLHGSGAQKHLHRWSLDGSLYVIPTSDTKAVIPLHRCSANLQIPGTGFSAPAQDLTLTADKLSPAIRITDSAALVEGLGRIFVFCSGSTSAVDIAWQSPLRLTFDLIPTGAERAAVAVANLHPEPVLESNQAGRWKL